VKRLFFCLLLFNFYGAQSQSLKWHDGSVVLASNHVVRGKISIEPFLDVILVEDNHRRTVYPAHKVSSLYFYDEAANINRRFVSILERNSHHTNYQFFEVVVYGEVNVLRRQKVKTLRPSDALDFMYYTQYNDDVVPLRKFGKKVCPRLKATSDSRLDDFIADNKLQAHTDPNSIRIVEYYNHLRLGEAAAKY